MYNFILYAVLIFIFLILSAFFSGMEAAIFSLSRFRIKALLFEEKKGAKNLERIKKDPGKTLAAILLANLLVNIGASSVATLFIIQLIRIHSFNSTISFILEFIIMTSLLLLVGEITPKTIAIANAEALSLKFSGTILTITNIFSPVSKIMEIFARRIVSYDSKSDYDIISDKEIKIMLSEAKKFNILDEGEEKFGYQILKFGKVKVNEIMTPRQKVVGIELDASIEKAKEVISTEKHSRICVFDRKGNVAGILYAKDLFISQMKNSRCEKSVSLRELIREPYIVPETKYVHSLLGEFRRKGIHISVVVDEFGNFSGIITLEDILESLYGEIIDEYDERDQLSDIPYQKINKNTYIFEGDISIGELSRILEIEPFDEEGERLSGFIFNYLGKIPREKEKIKTAGLEITVAEIRDRSIDKVIIRKL